MADAPLLNTRKYSHESGAGRKDVDGVEWFACDPYPTWYRWVNRELLTRDTTTVFSDKGQRPAAPWADPAP